jgi:hypothetical protein
VQTGGVAFKVDRGKGLVNTSNALLTTAKSALIVGLASCALVCAPATASAVEVQYTITFAANGQDTGGTAILTLNEVSRGNLIENTRLSEPLVISNLDGYAFTINLSNCSQWHIDLAAACSITCPETAMRKIPLDPDAADTALAEDMLTPHDHKHGITYLRLLDADAEGADWKEVAQIVLHIDPEREPGRARRAYESHLASAKWMTSRGYRLLLKNGLPDLN